MKLSKRLESLKEALEFHNKRLSAIETLDYEEMFKVMAVIVFVQDEIIEILESITFNKAKEKH